MNEKIRKHLVNYFKSQGWPCNNDNDLIETIKEIKTTIYEILKS